MEELCGQIEGGDPKVSKPPAHSLSTTTTTMPRALNRAAVAILKIKKNVTSSPFSCLDILLLSVSTFSFVADIGTDVVVIIQYYLRDHYMWMLLTLSLVCIPSLVVQVFSIRWYIIDGTVNNHLWIMHILQLGVFNRYLELFKAGLKVRRTKSASEIRKFNQKHSDICMLRLFESFMESAPQLVLQMYIMTSTGDWSIWTGISAVASVFSLSWGIAAYSKAMRNIRPEKNHLSWWGLIFQAMWRIGTVSARVISMVLFAVAYGPWLILVTFLHWLCMTLWVISQKTDFCSTWWEERLYNCVVGSIYCYCFFNLKEGRSRWRMALFYFVTSSQNISFVLCYHFSSKADPYKEVAVCLVAAGMVTGLTSMLFYYRFFHPSGPIIFCGTEDARTKVKEYENHLDTFSTLKTSRKPVSDVEALPSKGLSDTSVCLRDFNESVLSIQSNAACQSDLHRSHSLNCSFGDHCDMQPVTGSDLDMSIAKRTVLLSKSSKSSANHYRNVNYNFRTSVGFGHQLPKFHCSCLVLTKTESYKAFQRVGKPLFPSSSLPNIHMMEHAIPPNIVPPHSHLPTEGNTSCISDCIPDVSDIPYPALSRNSQMSDSDIHVQRNCTLPVLYCSSPAIKFIDDSDAKDDETMAAALKWEECGNPSDVLVMDNALTCSYNMNRQPYIEKDHVITLSVSY